MQQNTKTYTLDEAKKKLEAYCAYQDRSHYQVEKKLREMSMIPEAIDIIVLHLINEKFLNEARFAHSYARGKFRHKQWGKQKIVQGLKQHYIHQNLIEKALQEIDQDAYRECIAQLIEKKKKTLLGGNTYENKQKTIRYLYQKGYSYEEFVDFLE